jgi:uncharacterized protein (TIGR02001 family)
MSAACAASLCAGISAAQESQFSASGTLGVVSDYVFRGFSQTGNDPAIQASVTLSHESGAYVGLWGSNIDFGNDADYELDAFVGYGGAIGENTTFDVNVTYYAYPNAPGELNYDYLEVIGTITQSFGDASVYGKVALSPDFFGETGFATWVGTGAAYQVSDMFKVSGNIGYQWIDDNELAAIPDYFHYDVGASATFDLLTIDLRYHGTDIKGVGERLVGSAILSF